MRIHYLSTSSLPSRSANSLHVVRMCGALARAGHTVTLHGTTPRTGQDSEVFDYYGAERNFGLRRYRLPRVPVAARIVSLQAGWDARHAELVIARDLLAAQAACMFGARVIYEAHAPVSRNRLARQAFSWLVRQPGFLRLVVITHALKAWFVQHYPWLEPKIVVLPDAADPVADDVTPVDLPNAGKRLQIGYVGHLYEGKGMEVVSKLPALCPWADFSIVGGMDEDVRRWSESLSRIPNIRFYGHRPPREVARFLTAFDVVLLPNQRVVRAAGVRRSRHPQLDIAAWTSPLKMFEYMAAGKAIVASDLPVLREVLRDEVNALLCPPDRPEAWAERLALLSREPELRTRLGYEAAMEFQRAYTWDRRSEAMLSHLP